ncbi:phosphatase [Lithospermum erythrorhizon]|uniref:Phosphatase n=1 Tax=Lithospermum erythrorhizon TaxID=34254 RepID=A0AAV3NN38_LITER
MSLYQTRLCFVCSHLSSGQKEGAQERRNCDMLEILRRTHFSSALDNDQPLTIPCHEKLVASKKWDELLNCDQLCEELRRGHVFNGWKEGIINFASTYKYEFNSDRYAGENAKEGEKKRSPAWCDLEVEIFDPRKLQKVLHVKTAAVHPRMFDENEDSE